MSNVNVRQTIRFVLNDNDIALDAVSPDETLLDFLRLDRRLTGTKEGCAEGDCGACTVLVGRLNDCGEVRYQIVNSCIRLLASLDSCHVVTIEHLGGADGELHPVQKAMVDCHGSQCGFCTPGIVMALYALWMNTPEPSINEIETALQGNLCRCTGYEPIIKAAQTASSFGRPDGDRLVSGSGQIAARLSDLAEGVRVEVGKNGKRAILPASVNDLADVLDEIPNATIVAGATDAGLWVTKFMRSLSPAIFTDHLHELRRVVVEDDLVRIGAGVSFTDFEDVLMAHYPHMVEFWNRIAGWQVRNLGTIGGNIANGSPIGDTPPVLIALGADLVLRKGEHSRSVPLEDFFIDYGKQDLASGEFIEEIRVPRTVKDSIHGAYKISKRRDEDISSVAVGFNVTVVDGAVTAARIAFGGMAATPKRALFSETAIVGKPWTKTSVVQAAQEIEKDFTPLDDWRASAQYRLKVAQNLFLRFYLENSGTLPDCEPVRLSRA